MDVSISVSSMKRGAGTDRQTRIRNRVRLTHRDDVHRRHRTLDQPPVRSTSTRLVLYVVAPHGAARSSVSALAQPLVSAPSWFGLNHAPSLIETTPGAMRRVTLTG